MPTAWQRTGDLSGVNGSDFTFQHSYCLLAIGLTVDRWTLPGLGVGASSFPKMDQPDDRTPPARMWEADRASRAAGMSLDEVEPGRAVVSMTVRSDMVNGLGVCHGGYLFLLADSAMAFASNTAGSPAFAATAQIDFIAPAHVGERLVARAATQWSGRRAALHDVEVSDQSGRLVALFRGRTSRVTLPPPG